MTSPTEGVSVAFYLVGGRVRPARSALNLQISARRNCVESTESHRAVLCFSARGFKIVRSYANGHARFLSSAAFSSRRLHDGLSVDISNKSVNSSKVSRFATIVLAERDAPACRKTCCALGVDAMERNGALAILGIWFASSPSSPSSSSLPLVLSTNRAHLVALALRRRAPRSFPV